MSFRLKILVSIVFTFIFFFIFSDFVAKKLIFNDFDQLEHNYAISDMGRVLYFINDSFQNYDDTALDWSAWDDTYDFVRSNSQKYRQSNLTTQTMDNLRLHLLLIADEKGRVAFASGYDSVADKLTPVSAQLEKEVLAGFACTSPGKGKQGALLTPNGAMLINSRPIIKSDRSGPVRGTLIMGRYFNTFLLTRLASTTHLFVQVYSLNQPGLPAEVGDIVPALTKDPIILRNKGSDLMNGYLLLNDVFTRPAMVFKVEIPRPLHFQSQIFASLLSLVRLASFFFTGLVTLLVLQPLVLSPIHRVNELLQKVMARTNLFPCIDLGKLKGKDELAILELSATCMLSELERRHQPDRDPEP